MKTMLLAGCAILMSGCSVTHIGPPGATLTRPIRVKAEDVRIFEAAADVKGRFSVVESVWVRDDGMTLPRVLEQRLRALAGSRGANAIIMDPLNRKPNGTRIDLGPTLDDPFAYFRATAIWIGEGERPERYLGSLHMR